MPTNSTPAAAGTSCRSPFTHPLELVPWARRWPRSVARDLLYTLVWNALLAVIFTGFAVLFDRNTPALESLRINMVFAQAIGFVIHGFFMVADRLVPGLHHAPMGVRYVAYTVLPMIGVFVGYWIASEILGFHGMMRWWWTLRGFTAVAFLSLLISAILMLFFLQRERAARAETAMAHEQARVAVAEQAAATARLKMLEAQVEPHFLFNTLAHVVSMLDDDVRGARNMIERLIELLRTTAAAPDGPGTLESQLRWLRAYLSILELRMAARLRWRIDVPDELHAMRVPPMLLQPIVENAIRHGLEPKVEGGRIDITAERQDGGVRLVVRDTGLGFAAAGAADGIGLANLRARLASAYGDAARLVIEDNVPGGTSVSIWLPAPAAPA